MRHLFYGFITSFLLVSCNAIKTLKSFTYLKKGEAQAGQFSKTLNFTISNNLVFVAVMIHGHSYRFMLDTGAPPSIISAKVAVELGLKPRSTTTIYDSQGNSASQQSFLLDSISVGGVNFYNSPSIISELSGISAALCLNVDGIIGSALMRKAIWAFDFQKQTLLITNDKSSLPVFANQEKIPFTVGKFDYTPGIDISFDGQRFEKYLGFDMGSASGIQLGKYIIKQQSEKERFKYLTYSIGSSSVGLMGKGNTDSIFYSHKKALSIGTLQPGDQIVKYKKSGPSIIGMAVIRNFNVIINWFDQEITMSKVSEPDIAIINPFGFNYSFIDKECVVSEVFKDSDAERKGLWLQDTILFINGARYFNLEAAAQCELRKVSPFVASDSMQLIIKRNGEEMTLALGKQNYLPG